MNTGLPPFCRRLRVDDYDLDATLGGGQAFGWARVGAGWEGIVAGRWVRIEADAGAWTLATTRPERDWAWLDHYLGLDEDMASVLATFPDDAPMREAVAACHGLRLLRQDPWECLAGFICSTTKRVVQIQEMVRLLSRAHGEELEVPHGVEPRNGFPRPERIASADETALRACKLGFRAPYLLATARAVAEGRLDLDAVRRGTHEEARSALMGMPGVGRKVADCAMLFGFGFQKAFPVDVWVSRALRRLYFPRARRLTPERLLRFSETHFGPRGGYAQQYLFHHARVNLGREWAAQDARAMAPKARRGQPEARRRAASAEPK